MLTNTVIKMTFGDLATNKRDSFPMRRVLSHRVRLSLIAYSSTSQKKWLQIRCIINKYFYPLKET